MTATARPQQPLRPLSSATDLTDLTELTDYTNSALDPDVRARGGSAPPRGGLVAVTMP